MMKRLLILAGALLLGGCLDTTAPKGSDPLTETFASSLGIDINTFLVTPSGTFYKDVTTGSGANLGYNTAALGTTLNVDYTGYLANGTVFSSGTGASLVLGNLVYGLIDGIIGMNAGGERIIVIPSDFGYGGASTNIGTPPVTIPANSTLVFRIKLNSFTN